MIKIEWLIYTMKVLLIFDSSFILAVLIRKLVNYVLVNLKKRHEDNNLQMIEESLKNKDITPVLKLRHGRISKLVIKEILIEKYPSAPLMDRLVMDSIAEHFKIYQQEIRWLKSIKWWVQANAAYELGVFRVRDSLPLLLEKLEKTKNREIKLRASEAILKISNGRYLYDVMSNIQILNNKNHNHLIDLIVKIEEDIFPVAEIIFTQNNLLSIRICVEALGKRQDERIVPLLIECLKSELIEVKISGLKATESLGFIDNNEDVLNCLLALKGHDVWIIRSFLAKALAYYESEETYKILEELIHDSKWRVRYNAGQSLYMMNGRGIMTLSQILSSEDRFARDMAWQLLQKEKLINKFGKFKKEEKLLKLRTLFNMEVYSKSQSGG